MTLRSLRISAGVSGAELAEKLKPMFPRVNKQVISYAEDPSNTGVTLTSAMRKEVEIQTGHKFNARDIGRKDVARLSVWLPESARNEFNAIKKEMNLTTDKETVIRLIRQAYNGQLWTAQSDIVHTPDYKSEEKRSQYD